eukprot:scaffold73225_cov63-Phaeocystis_antarctica.AAC.3
MTFATSMIMNRLSSPNVRALRARRHAASSLRPRSSPERGTATSASSSKPDHPSSRISTLHVHTKTDLVEQPQRDKVVRCRRSPFAPCSPLPPFASCSPFRRWAARGLS